MTGSGQVFIVALPVIAAALLASLALSGGLLPTPWGGRVEKTLNLFLLAAVGAMTVWRLALAAQERSFNSAVSALTFGFILVGALSRTMRRGWWAAGSPIGRGGDSGSARAVDQTLARDRGGLRR